MRLLGSSLRLPHELWAITRSRAFSTSAPAAPSSSSAKHFYVTTPIFYVNADPHIGHLHSTLLADVYSRFARLREPTSPPPILCTGTDEHGLKIQRVAEGRGIAPKVLCDSVSERFKDLAQAANVDYNIFIRTTEERHRIAVHHVWASLKLLESKGFIYKSSYAGWYAVSDEAYYSETQVMEVEEATGGKQMVRYPVSIETGTKVEWMEEENYKFRLSAFREKLIEWLSTDPNVLQPPSRTATLLAEISTPGSPDLQDLSISRPSSRLSWGVSVPGDDEHTIYVWIDALINYLTAAGYPWRGGEAFKEGQVWPPEVMVVGKDIIRFHALYLPAVLMALDLPLPRNILAHGHWTMDKFKMSKSRGNVANPFEALKVWGVDAMRTYLMWWGGNSANDSDYSAAEIERFYRKDLVGQLGNLLSRVSNKKLLKKLPSPASFYTTPSSIHPDDQELAESLNNLTGRIEAHIDTFEVDRAIAAVFDALTLANERVQSLSPWLPSASHEDSQRALFFASETLRIVGIVLQPIMPTKSHEILDTLGVPTDRRRWEDAKLGMGGPRTMKTNRKVHLFPSIAFGDSTPSHQT
ncbi:methionyl-tRNA synthetase [Meredithblackwellia eburnea MCA 4105]